MAINKFVLAKEGPGEDPSKKRIQSLDNQIKQARELLKKAKESDPKSERVFNLQQRVNNLTTQKDRAKKRADDRKDSKEEKAGVEVSPGIRCKCIPAFCKCKPHTVARKSCARHGKTDCESTMCPESPNFNVLTQI
jgi:hypothetical protein